MADADKGYPAKSMLKELAKMAVTTQHRTLKKKDEYYDQELLKLFKMVEHAAGMLEGHEYRCTGQRTKQALLKLYEGSVSCSGFAKAVS